MNTVSVTGLTPLSFLQRAAEVFPDKPAIVYADRSVTYRGFAAEATRLARALQESGVGAGDRVAFLCPNIPEMLVAHFAVPLAGAVLVAINTRLSAEEVRDICDHSGAKLLVVDSEFLPGLAPVLAELRTVQEVVAVTDPIGPAGRTRRGPRRSATPTCSLVARMSRCHGPSMMSWRPSRSTTPSGRPGGRRGCSIRIGVLT